MSRKKDDSSTVSRLSPTATLSHVTDELMKEFNIPALPENVPARLEEAIRKRVQALLYAIKEARTRRYAPVLETRLIRDAYRAVLTAYELGLADGEVYFAQFRSLVEEMGYERAAIGFKKGEGAEG